MRQAPRRAIDPRSLLVKTKNKQATPAWIVVYGRLFQVCRELPGFHFRLAAVSQLKLEFLENCLPLAQRFFRFAMRTCIFEFNHCDQQIEGCAIR